MRTYFAKPDRTGTTDLNTEIKVVNSNPVVSGLLNTLNSILAVLDENRQIIALNKTFFEFLGLKTCDSVLGLRLGEALQCEHAYKEKYGCGTSKYCSTCGAAIAMVSSLNSSEPCEKVCALKTENENFTFLIRAIPINSNKNRLLLLFIRDITRQQEQAALERTFFHDINNLLTSLSASSQILLTKTNSKYAKIVNRSVQHLVKEIKMQHLLKKNDSTDYKIVSEPITIKNIITELKNFFQNHPLALNKEIQYFFFDKDLDFKSDLSIILRILCNMTLNALEACNPGEIVKISSEIKKNELRFYVWNKQAIPPKIQKRIFQKNFSTKNNIGRGLGTYSMKLFGEKILNGEISFTSNPQDGTTFIFKLPI